MKIKIFFTFILLVLSLYSQGQPIQKSGKSDTEKKVENYIIDKTKTKYYHSIEFGEITPLLLQEVKSLIEQLQSPEYTDFIRTYSFTDRMTDEKLEEVKEKTAKLKRG